MMVCDGPRRQQTRETVHSTGTASTTDAAVHHMQAKLEADVQHAELDRPLHLQRHWLPLGGRGRQQLIERERERKCVWEREKVCVGERESVCVRERERQMAACLQYADARPVTMASLAGGALRTCCVRLEQWQEHLGECAPDELGRALDQASRDGTRCRPRHW